MVLSLSSSPSYLDTLHCVLQQFSGYLFWSIVSTKSKIWFHDNKKKHTNELTNCWSVQIPLNCFSLFSICACGFFVHRNVASGGWKFDGFDLTPLIADAIFEYARQYSIHSGRHCLLNVPCIKWISWRAWWSRLAFKWNLLIHNINYCCMWFYESGVIGNFDTSFDLVIGHCVNWCNLWMNELFTAALASLVKHWASLSHFRLLNEGALEY